MDRVLGVKYIITLDKLGMTADSIIRRDGELRLVGFEWAAIGAETALMVYHAQPGGVTATRPRGIKNINVGAAMTPVMFAAAPRLRTGHDPLSLAIRSEKNHHVGDGRLPFGLVGIFPEKKITRFQVLAEKIAIGESAGDLRHIPSLVLQMEIVVLVGSRARQLDARGDLINVAGGIGTIHVPGMRLAGRAPGIVVLNIPIAEIAGHLQKATAPFVRGSGKDRTGAATGQFGRGWQRGGHRFCRSGKFGLLRFRRMFGRGS